MSVVVCPDQSSRSSPPRVTPDDSDRHLIRRLQERQVEAVGELYDRYGALAFNLARRLLGDQSAAEDTVQEAFLSIWRQAASYDPHRGSLRSWVLSIVHHRAIDQLRLRRGRVQIDITAIDQRATADADDDPWHGVVIQLERERVRRALKALSDEQRRVIDLLFFAGYSQPEAAQALGVPLTTIKGRVRLALLKLRVALSP